MPVTKVNDRDHSPKAKGSSINDIDSLIEPPAKHENEGINAAAIERL